MSFSWGQHSDTPGSALPALPGTLFLPRTPRVPTAPQLTHMQSGPRWVSPLTPTPHGEMGKEATASHHLGEKNSLKQPSHRHRSSKASAETHNITHKQRCVVPFVATTAPQGTVTPAPSLLVVICLWFQQDFTCRPGGTAQHIPDQDLLCKALLFPHLQILFNTTPTYVTIKIKKKKIVSLPKKNPS